MSKSSPKKSDDLVIGPPPRADLLPPELKAEVKAKAQRRGLLLIVAMAVALVIAGYAYATINATVASARLASANERTVSLLEEQGKFVEAKIVAEQTAAIGKARILGASTEINWADYLRGVEKSLPAGTKLTVVTAKTSPPGGVSAEPVSPLEAANIAVMNFTANSKDLPDVSKWIDNLAKLPGFADASAKTIERDDDTGEYTVTIIMHINEKALSNRFAPEKAETE